MKLIPSLAILAILSRVIYFYMNHGKHDGRYFQQLEYCRDSAQFIIIGLLLIILKRKQVDYCLLIIKFGVWFCFATPVVLLLYGFLPDSINTSLLPFIWVYFVTWAAVCIALIIYYVHCIKGDLLA